MWRWKLAENSKKLGISGGLKSQELTRHILFALRLKRWGEQTSHSELSITVLLPLTDVICLVAQIRNSQT